MTTAQTFSHSLARVALATAALLSIPFVAMRFTDQVAWSGSDFVVAGALLGGAGLAFELMARRGGGTPYRLGVAMAVGTALLLVWVNLAVGFLGSENNPANLMYLGVLAVEVAGVALARFQARGMATALFATAAAQAAVGVVALAMGLGGTESGPTEIVLTHGLFVALFAGAGLLFRQSARA